VVGIGPSVRAVVSSEAAGCSFSKYAREERFAVVLGWS
jgi:hypothetical protein